MTSVDLSDALHCQKSNVTGIVLAAQANYYQVQLEPLEPYLAMPLVDVAQQKHQPPTLLCTRRARLKKIRQQVMVGDRVRVEEPDWLGKRGAIAEVFPRATQLDRPPVANASQILLIFSLAEPEIEPLQLSRFLVKAESTGLNVKLGLSKLDLVDEQVQHDWYARLKAWGYEPLLFSLHYRQGLGVLMPLLAQNVTIISGPSGVGKSSLINYLVPELSLRVGRVSGKLGRGRHTTRHVELFELENGGLVADSPGFNQPDFDFTVEELVRYFPEGRQKLAAQSCQFTDCLHQEEPGCCVRGDWERYSHYVTFLQEIQALQVAKEQTRNPEAVLKRKIAGAGQVEYEPRLAEKKYRRKSRRSSRQSLQDFTGSTADWLEQNVEEPEY